MTTTTPANEKENTLLSPEKEELVSPSIIQEIISGYNKDSQLVSYSVKLGTKPGDNFMSIMYSAEILLKTKLRTEDPEKINVMIKTMPKNALRIKELNELATFPKEIGTYSKILPEMIRFQQDKGLEDASIFMGWPKCWASFINGTDDYLAMEDLRGKGYQMANRITGLNSDQTRLVLSQLARFHAISFAQFGGNATQILTAYPFLEEKMFPNPKKLEHSLKSYFKSLLRHEVKIVRDSGHEKEGDMLAAFCGDDIDAILLTKINKIVTGERNAVVNHGDCWTNNILFLYDKEKLVGLKLLDFQEVRCAPRSVEVSYFLCACAPSEELNEREEEYLKLYNDEFNKFLDQLGFKEELSFSDFMEEYDTCKFYGIIMGLMMAPLMCADSESVPDMEGMSETDRTAEGATQVFDKVSGSEANRKIINLAVHHLPRCPQVKV